MAESAYSGVGFRSLVERAAARRRALADEQIALYEEVAKLRAAKQQAAAGQALAAPPANGEQAQTQATSPLFDPNSNFSKYLAQHGMTAEQYMQQPLAWREQKIANPYIEAAWTNRVATDPALRQLGGDKLQRAKEQYFNEARNALAANFTALEDADSVWDKAKNFAGSVVHGAGGAINALGGIADAVGGDDNVVARIAHAGGNFIESAGNGLKSEAALDHERSVQKFLQDGEYAEAGKLLGKSPTQIANLVADTVGGFGGYGTALKLGTKGTALALKAGRAVNTAEKVTNAGNKLARSAVAYSGVQGGGQVANELKQRGIDPSTMDGRLAVLSSFLVSAGATKLMPSTIEKQISRMGLSKDAASVLSKQVINDAKNMGLLRTGLKYTGGLAKNTLSLGVGEGAEEFVQEGAGALFAQALIGPDGKLRSWSEVPEETKELVKTRAMAGGFMGAVAGGAFGAGRNSLNKFGDAETAEDYRRSESFYDRHDKIAEDYNKARAKRVAEEEDARRMEELLAEEEAARQAAEQAQTEEEFERAEQARAAAKAKAEFYTKQAQHRNEILGAYGDAMSVKNADKLAKRAGFSEHLNNLRNEVEDGVVSNIDDNAWSSMALDQQANLLVNDGIDADTVYGEFAKKRSTKKGVNYALDFDTHQFGLTEAQKQTYEDLVATLDADSPLRRKLETAAMYGDFDTITKEKSAIEKDRAAAEAEAARAQNEAKKQLDKANEEAEKQAAKDAKEEFDNQVNSQVRQFDLEHTSALAAANALYDTTSKPSNSARNAAKKLAYSKLLRSIFLSVDENTRSNYEDAFNNADNFAVQENILRIVNKEDVLNSVKSKLKLHNLSEQAIWRDTTQQKLSALRERLEKSADQESSAKISKKLDIAEQLLDTDYIDRLYARDLEAYTPPQKGEGLKVKKDGRGLRK